MLKIKEINQKPILPMLWPSHNLMHNVQLMPSIKVAAVAILLRCVGNLRFRTTHLPHQNQTS